MKQNRKSTLLRLLALALVLAAGTGSNAAAQDSTAAAVPVSTAALSGSTATLPVSTAAASGSTAAVPVSPLTLGIRTNFLSWATLSPSLGIDLQWGTRWQATLDGSIGLASTHTRNGYGCHSRISSIGLEARRYFSTAHRSADQPQGATHHGVYLGLGVRHMHVDFKTDAAATALGREGTVNTAGLIVGYTFWLPARFSVDAALGAGYLHRYYNRYTWYAPQNQNRLVDTRNRGMLGLTHAEISLVYHFNLK